MRLLKIGRDPSCNIVMHSDKVSSLHAELTLLNNGDILLEDKGSRNGTFIMNQQIKPNKPVNVRRGDAIRFADVELQWSQVPPPEDNSAYQGLYGIGSHFNNDFQISGSTVSRYHATVKHGRDNKMYIVDHSKNGTTVDGVKISPNTPVQIKRNSSVVCGGVPVDLSRLPWPKNVWKPVLTIAASLLVLIGLGFGIWKLIGRDTQWDSTKIYDRYSSTIVMLMGLYHYEVSAGSEDATKVLKEFGMPTRILWNDEKCTFVDMDYLTSSQIAAYGSYSATGFFVSEDGKIVTNLHVVKPWLFHKHINLLVEKYKLKFAAEVENQNATLASLGISTAGLTALISQIKFEGVLDQVFFVPQGRFLSSENAISCRVLNAGDDENIDVALIQSDKMELPNRGASYVNVVDSLDTSPGALKVGYQMFTLGFPHGENGQFIDSEKGLQVYCHSGHITRESEKYSFMFDAVSAGGASGSPIFNDHGKLIGVVCAGIEKENMNEAIKAEYVKQLFDKNTTK